MNSASRRLFQWRMHAFWRLFVLSEVHLSISKRKVKAVWKESLIQRTHWDSVKANKAECFKQVTTTPNLNYQNLANVRITKTAPSQTSLCSPNQIFEMSGPNNLVSSDAYVTTDVGRC